MNALYHEQEPDARTLINFLLTTFPTLYPNLTALAKALHVTRETISRVKNGDKKAGGKLLLDALVALAQATGRQEQTTQEQIQTFNKNYVTSSSPVSKPESTLTREDKEELRAMVRLYLEYGISEKGLPEELAAILEASAIDENELAEEDREAWEYARRFYKLERAKYETDQRARDQAYIARYLEYGTSEEGISEDIAALLEDDNPDTSELSEEDIDVLERLRGLLQIERLKQEQEQETPSWIDAIIDALLPYVGYALAGAAIIGACLYGEKKKPKPGTPDIPGNQGTGTL